MRSLDHKVQSEIEYEDSIRKPEVIWERLGARGRDIMLQEAEHKFAFYNILLNYNKFGIKSSISWRISGINLRTPFNKALFH